MNKNHFLINTIIHLINLFTFSTIILIASPAHSQANCYMLDQNGDLLDLSSICGQKPLKTNNDVAEEESEKDESPEKETSNNSEEDQENSSTNDNGDSNEEEENNSDENDSEEVKEETEDNPENTK